MKSTLNTHLSLARASNLPTVWSNVLCAFLLAGSLQWAALSAAIVAVSLFYIGGMYLNDWKDAEHDARHRPERPIPSQLISRNTVLLFAVAYFVAALAISVFINPGSTPWALGLAACIAFYDLHHKENAMSPWVMAGCRALIYPWAASLSGSAIPAELWLAGAAAYGYTLGLTYIARDPRWSTAFRRFWKGRKNRQNDTPKKFMLCACVLLPAGIWANHLVETCSALAVLALIAFLAWTAFSLTGWFFAPPRIEFTVRNLIAGFFLVDLLAISAAGAVPELILLLIAVLFIATLKIQRIISGT